MFEPDTRNQYERCALPEGAIVNCEIEIIGYFDPADPSEMRYASRRAIDTTKSSVIGLMEMVKHDMMTESWSDDDAEE